MRPESVALVLLSAAVHVYWNHQVKCSKDPVAFTWWLQVLGGLLSLPVGILAAESPRIPATGWLCISGTGLIYGAYYSFIAYSYRREDLSCAYPIARGVAPVAGVLFGLLVYHEVPSAFGLAGVALICLGIAALSASSIQAKGSDLSLPGIAAAVATGVCTAGYSAVDKLGIRFVHPILYISLTFLAGAAAQSWLVLRMRNRDALLKFISQNGPSLLSSAVLATAAYLIILYVLRTEPVSYVVPLRSVSVVMSVVVGSRFLSENVGSLRLPAAFVVFLGISALASGR
ncbi:MAG: EamA family transporter [Armatimonadota bacterium]